MTPALTFANRSTSRRLGVAAVLFVLVLAVLLAGCGAGGSSDGGTASKPVAEGGAPASVNAEGEERASALSEESASGGTTAAPSERTSARVLPLGRDIVYRGRITVRVRDVARAATRAEDLTLAADGVVFSEQTSVDPRRRALGEATLSLRVPPTQFASTLDALGRLGKELGRTRSAQDVTAELADTDSRVRTQERSVARVRALLSEADTIGEVVRVESELARREADLESLQAQLARLRDVTDLASIDVTLVTRGAPAPPEPEDELGFVSGLHGGWDAFVSIVLVALTVLGALLPFAIAALIVGFPAYLLLRARRRPAATPPAAEA